MNDIGSSPQRTENGPYPLPGTPRETSLPLATTDESVWKTYASPSGTYRLFANTQTGLFRVLHSGERDLGAPSVHVPSYSAHLQDAKDWVQSLADEAKKHMLQMTLQETNSADIRYYKAVQRLGWVGTGIGSGDKPGS